MTEQEINCEIAKEDGWTDLKVNRDGTWFGKCPGLRIIEHVPNYWEDLNAMRRPVNRLLPVERDAYQQWLSTVVNRKHRMATTSWLMLTAEAKDQAEAFLRMRGKWNES